MKIQIKVWHHALFYSFETLFANCDTIAPTMIPVREILEIRGNGRSCSGLGDQLNVQARS